MKGFELKVCEYYSHHNKIPVQDQWGILQGYYYIYFRRNSWCRWRRIKKVLHHSKGYVTAVPYGSDDPNELIKIAKSLTNYQYCVAYNKVVEKTCKELSAKQKSRQYNCYHLHP